MIRPSLGDGPLRVLCIGAHADDLEIGCGGTVLRLAAEGRIQSIHWLVLSAAGEREAEARAGARAFLEGVAEATVEVEAFRDGYFPGQYIEIKDRFERLKGVQPDLVLTHRRDDAHQDHRLVGELTWNTFRDHLVLEYEIPKYDGDLGRPNVFVELSESVVRRKAELLEATFGSQRDRHWFDATTFVGLARLRGVEARAREGYAEGFHARKLVI